MAKVNSSNFTDPVQASYHSVDTDVYSRNDAFTAFLQDVDVHDHRIGHGVASGRLTTTAIAATANTGECQVTTGGLIVTDGTTQNNLVDITQNGATAFKCIGLTGATAASRYVGATTGGAPGSGTFSVGDFVIDRTGGQVWICTSAGSPGTWSRVSAGVVLSSQKLVADGAFSHVTVTGYTAVDIIFHGRSALAASSDVLMLQLNNDTTAAHYVSQETYSNGNAVNALGTQYAGSLSGLACGDISGNSATASYAGQSKISLGNISDTTFFKSASAMTIGPVNATNIYAEAAGGIFLSTAAITDLSVTVAGGSGFKSGSSLMVIGY